MPESEAAVDSTKKGGLKWGVGRYVVGGGEVLDTAKREGRGTGRVEEDSPTSHKGPFLRG